MTSMIGNRGMNATGFNVGQGRTGSIVPKGYKYGQLQQFNPQQMQLFSQLFSQLGPDSFLSKLAGGDESTFEQAEAPALRQFQGLQGQIASRFSGMGTGARKSSGFQNEMNQYTSDFAQKLQSNRMDLQQQAVRDLINLSNVLLSQKPYEPFITPKSTSGWQNLLGGVLGGAAGGLGSGFGGSVFKRFFG